jgi:hypothetical protein
MVRQNHLSAVADGDSTRGEPAGFIETSELLEQYLRIYHHAIAQNAQAPGMKHSRRNQVKNALLSAYDEGVTGVVATLKTNDDVCLGSQSIYDFTFAFIAPLSAHNCDY